MAGIRNTPLKVLNGYSEITDIKPVSEEIREWPNEAGVKLPPSCHKAPRC